MKRSKVTRRSFLCDALAVGAGALIAACGPGPAPTPAPALTKAPEAPKPAAEPTKPAAAAATTAKPGARQVNIRWWAGGRGDDFEAFRLAPKTYTAKYPNVSIEFASIIDLGGLTKVQTAIAAGDPPELVSSSDRAGGLGIYYRDGIQVLDDYIKADKDFDVKALEPASMAGCRSHDGKQWAIPNQIYVGSNLFYNRKMFKEKGLDPAAPPVTLEDLEKIAAMFDVRKGDQLISVGFHPSTGHGAQVYVFANEGKFFDAEKGKVTADDPGVVAGLEWLVKYYRKYGVEDLRRLLGGYGQYQSPQNPFLAEQVAMIGFWDAMVAYRNRYAPTVEYEHAWFPYAANHPGAKGFGVLNFNPHWIPKTAKEKDTAWHILSTVHMDAETVLQISILLANTPENLKSLALPAADKADPILRKCWNYAAKGKMDFFPPSMPAAAEYNQEWGRQLDLMQAGKVSVKDGVQEIIKVVQPLVDKALRG